MDQNCNQTQQQHCERRFDELSRKLTEIHDAVVGTAERPGLGERVRTLEAAESSRAKIRWALVTGFLGQSIVLIGIALRHLLSKSN